MKGPGADAPVRPWLRLPAYAVNGIAVALGIGGVHLLFGSVGGPAAAQIAGSAAVCASLADLPNTVDRTWQRVLGAGVLAVCSTLLVALLAGHPVALGVAIMAMAFIAMMTMAWGARAGPVSFAPILALVFAMALPPGEYGVVAQVGWSLAGAGVYLGWSVVASALLQRHYRRLALVAAMRAAASLLRSRAELLRAAAEATRDEAALGHWIADEAALAERLQVARDLLFAAPDEARTRRGTAILLHAIDLRDVLLASRLDLELLGRDASGRLVLERIAACLRSIGAALDALADARRDRAAAAAPVRIVPAPAQLFDDVALPADDPRARALPAIAGRLRQLADNVVAIERLVAGVEENLPLTREQLQRFVGSEVWPLAALRGQLTTASPVLRHALRMSLALGTAYFLARLLPWASHPHWLVLSVAVVLRGTLEQTLTRRNGRVLGTVLGCLIVVGLQRSESPAVIEAFFLTAVGVAHSYVNVLYWVTSSAATVMALLQSHLADPLGGFAIGERLADTVLGAALAWGFSYVLPSWERSSVPQAVGRAVAALERYAVRVLAPDPVDAVEQRLARRNAYDAFGAVAAAAQRSAFEPKRARLPVDEVTAFLDHGQRLLAHLSSLRLMRVRRADVLQRPEAVEALRNASTELTGCLVGAAGADRRGERSGALSAAALPEETPEADPLPWLLRRLQLALDDARRVRAAATALVAQVF
jgi:uncharacterized membrane protein YccC